MAAFSTGPVGVGDGPNATDISIVMPTCDAAGRLLQPDRPLLAIDATFARVGQDERGAPNGQCKSTWMSAADGGAVWASVTELPWGADRSQVNGNDRGVRSQTTHFVLGINVSRPFVLSRSDLWPRGKTNATYLSRRWRGLDDRSSACIHGSRAVASGCVHRSAPAESLPDVRSHGEGVDGRYAVGESPFVLVAIHEVSTTMIVSGRYKRDAT